MRNSITEQLPGTVSDEFGLAGLIGRRIRRQRIRLGLSLTGVADAVGLGVSSLSNIETGQRNASLQVVVRLCSVLSLPVEKVVDTNLETVGWKVPRIPSLEGDMQEFSLQLLTDPNEARLAMVNATLPFGCQCHVDDAGPGVLTDIQKSGYSIVRSDVIEELLQPGDALTLRQRKSLIWLSVGGGHSLHGPVDRDARRRFG